MLLLDKTIGRWVPVRFVAFSLVGGVGDSYDNALAETIIGPFKTEINHHHGPWRNRGHARLEREQQQLGHRSGLGMRTIEDTKDLQPSRKRPCPGSRIAERRSDR